MSEINITNDWLAGFLFGQHIYKTGKNKELLISLPLNSSAVGELATILNEKPYLKGKRHIIKLKNKKIDQALQKWSPKTGSAEFLIGLMESNFDVFVERTMFGTKILRTRQYIKLPNHIVVKNTLNSLNIKYAAANKSSIKITKKNECLKFLKAFAPERFVIYRDELMNKRPAF